MTGIIVTQIEAVATMEKQDATMSQAPEGDHRLTDAARRNAHDDATTGNSARAPGAADGTAARCPCGRRIRVAGSVLDAGPITCGLCHGEFAGVPPRTLGPGPMMPAAIDHPDTAGRPDVSGLSDVARLRWTSVPRWPAPALPAAASYLTCCFGGAGERQARALLKTADPDVPARTETFADGWNAATEAALGRLIGESLAGVRIILAGAEAVVMRAAALARRLGAISEELVLIAADVAPAGPSDVRVPPDVSTPSAVRVPSSVPGPSDVLVPSDVRVPSGVPAPSGTHGLSAASRPFGEPGTAGGEYVSGRAARRVFCAACRASFDAVAALGEVVTCPGCAVGLTVDRRFSRPHAAYFGWPTGLDLHQ